MKFEIGQWVKTKFHAHTIGEVAEVLDAGTDTVQVRVVFENWAAWYAASDIREVR